MNHNTPEHSGFRDTTTGEQWTHEEADKVICQLLDRETELKKQLAEERKANEAIELNISQQLAAKREKRWVPAHMTKEDEGFYWETNEELRQQLDAERDKAHVRETELICERDYFKAQLAAERETNENRLEQLRIKECDMQLLRDELDEQAEVILQGIITVQQLKEQLADEREKQIICPHCGWEFVIT